MKTSHLASNSKAQLKIQQTAFMLVALVILFAMVGLIYFSITLSGLREDAERLQDKEAREIVRKLAGSPEFGFTADTSCSSCIDLDKVYQLSKMQTYKGFWNLDYLVVEKIYPQEDNENCLNDYPNCRFIEIIKEDDFQSATSAFVTLARWDATIGAKGGYVYEFGRIYASGKGPND